MESDDVDLYDIVVALDVLEHIPRAELRKYLRRLVDLTRPGGLLVFRFPNSQSPLGLAIQHADITHETALSVPIMEQLIQGLPVQFAAVREMRFPGCRIAFAGLRLFHG
jgi:2-polyprenyl-3-methyl-5-hydroxy-6-metoxy-1,4-benzoquinol methylase